MIIADTDVLIDYLEGRGLGAEAVFQALRGDELQTTTINYFELLVGAVTEGAEFSPGCGFGPGK